MMTTNLLQLNMPNLMSQYGEKVQFDVVSTIDQEFFLRNKKGSATNGFTINEKGQFVGTLNFISYLKVKPIVRKERHPDDPTKAEDEEDDDSDDLDEERFKELIDSSGTDWVVARTIYSTF